MPEELWTKVVTLYRRDDQNHPQKKKCKKAKWLSKEALQIAEERREVIGKEERERKIYPIQHRIPEKIKKR